MRELVRYTCATCGGALIINRSEQVFKCPFCGNGFDVARMHKKEILNDAETNLKQMEYNAAKDKFDSLLKSDPQDFDALKGHVFCAGKLRGTESFQSIERIRNCEWTELVKTLTDVKTRAREEDVPFFNKICELLVTIEEQTKAQNALTAANKQYKHELDNQTQAEEGFRGGLIFFMFIFILFTMAIFVGYDPLSGIYVGIACVVIFIILYILFKILGKIAWNSHQKQMYLIRKEIFEAKTKLDEIEDKYDKDYHELISMDHSDTDANAPAYSPLQDYSEE